MVSHYAPAVAAKIHLPSFDVIDVALCAHEPAKRYSRRRAAFLRYHIASASPASPKLRLPEAITPRMRARLCSSFKKRITCRGTAPAIPPPPHDLYQIQNVRFAHLNSPCSLSGIRVAGKSRRRRIKRCAFSELPKKQTSAPTRLPRGVSGADG